LRFLLVLLTLSLVCNVVMATMLLRQGAARQPGDLLAILPPGSVVKPFEAAGLDGRRSTVEFSAGNQPTVLYVFTPQCRWCMRNLKNLSALYGARGGTYRFIGVSLEATNLQSYAAGNGIKFRILHDLSPETIAEYRLGPTPETLVISTDGVVLKNWVGAYQDSVLSDVESYFAVKLPGIQLAPELAEKAK
jgi:peroxiredoxin